jgi:hypothetical protein
MDHIDRRTFLKVSATTGALTLAGGKTDAFAEPRSPAGKPAAGKRMVGIQIPAVSFVDEGVNAVLDTVQERARVNTLFLTVLAFNEGLAGRQLAGYALPDHGKQAHNEDFQGGYYATLRPQYHKNPLYRHFRAPDHGDFDLLAEVLPEAKKRGLKTVVFLADNLRSTLPGADTLTERDLYGKPTHEVCLNNPRYQQLLMGILEDCVRSYDVDGVLYRSERIGPLSKTLGLNHFGPSPAVCFCQYCAAKAKKADIRPDRVRQGYEALAGFVKDSRGGKRPNDGYYVQFWRILLRHPEILQWQTFQTGSMQELYQAVYKKVKGFKPGLPVGWAVALNNNLNPIYRAEQDWGALSRYSDFLKVVMYHNVGGPRMVKYIDNLGSALMADLPKDQLLEWEYAVMNYKERGYDQIAFTGFSSDYVYREAKRCAEGLAGTPTQLWAGIDVNLPTEENHTKGTPQSIKGAVLAAFRGGAHGVVLARKYSEMQLASLGAVGEAVKELEAGQ